ncbi:hypothetical protein BOTBODRAFT_422193 [Botryobasidium botryosum FD-172 SS1]|uniref:Secreted protein n=1 Tax=Botryobasidium botryosum (strain FD-172 SS1) TaxID=930990 RepID=A0A067M9D2_BOTB1|nr:hypothetical protein BOTBODRAFT_422193 [Botryobasidium botryosum FD-172 SS1]
MGILKGWVLLIEGCCFAALWNLARWTCSSRVSRPWTPDKGSVALAPAASTLKQNPFPRRSRIIPNLECLLLYTKKEYYVSTSEK